MTDQVHDDQQRNRPAGLGCNERLGAGAEARTALERFKQSGGHEEPDPVERLRFFCSLAMNGQDWIDVEPFFDDVLAERAAPNARANARP